MHWLELGVPARRAGRDASSAPGLVGSAASCPLRARGSCPSASTSRQRADAARLRETKDHADAGARSRRGRLADVAEWRSEALLRGAVGHEPSALATAPLRLRRHHAPAPTCQSARPCGQASWSCRRPRTRPTARNHCILGKTSGRRAPSRVFYSVFVEDVKSSRNEFHDFYFSCRRRLPQDACAQQRIGASGAHLPQKHMVWRRGPGASGQGSAAPRAGILAEQSTAS